MQFSGVSSQIRVGNLESKKCRSILVSILEGDEDSGESDADSNTDDPGNEKKTTKKA